MEFITSGNPFIVNGIILIVVLLYISFLILLIVNEIKNNENKFTSFLWIFSAVICPIIPFVYAILLLIKKVIK
jgi:hypothetical protein